MTRTCSTAGCRRLPRPGWAICDPDVLELVAPRPAGLIRVARLSSDPMFLSGDLPAPRPRQPDANTEVTAA